MRKALASYNTGLPRVQALVAARGDQWEAGLPAETRQYLQAILGGASPRFPLTPPPAALSGNAGGAGAAPAD